MMLVRRALPEDAAAAVAVMRRSIEQLCAEDWRHDRAVLARWLANKTAANVLRWMAAEDRTLLVAAPGGRVAAVGLVHHGGEIQLNYVDPDHRFQGAGKALMAAMEARLRGLGVTRARLFSSQVARSFYRARGYVEVGPVPSDFGTLDMTEMVKAL